MVTTSVRFYFYGWLRVLALSCSILLSPLSNAETVKDLSYGVTLYHFFQQQYFSALTELMAAEDQSRLNHHAVTAELLKGGMSLSYGLDKNAETIFKKMLHPDQSLITVDLSQQQKSRAWFYLGKMIYQQGDYPRALSTLKFVQHSVDNNDQWSMIDEANYLQATMLLKQNREQAAQGYMENINSTSIYWPYYYFNLGSLYSNRQNWQQAAEFFELCNQLMINKQEERVLRDRANTAAGYAYLSLQQFASAVVAFQRININSPLVDNALLGYGLAESERQDFVAALAPWQALRKRSLLLPSVQEVFLALPYAYEKLGSLKAALSEYEGAAFAYKKELKEIDKAINSYQQKSLTELFEFGSLDSNWFVNGELSAEQEDAYYLGHLLGQHRFQRQLKEYRDLLLLDKILQAAEKKILLLTSVDDEQQQHWQQLVSSDRLQQLAGKRQSLVESRDKLVDDINLAEKDTSGKKLVQEADRLLWQRLQRAQQQAENLQNMDVELGYEKELLQRFEGLLLWKSSEDYIENRWQLKQQLQQLDIAIEQSNKALTIVNNAMAGKSQSQFSAQLSSIQTRADIQQQKINDSLVLTDKKIRSLAINDLTDQRQQLKNYLGRATLSIARLYDLGNEQAIEQVESDE